MVYGDAGLEETTDIEQRTVISKMHSMQWLKSNSQLFGHSKAFPHGNENKTESLKEDIDQVVDGSIKILSSTNSINHPNIEQSDSSVSKDYTEKDKPATGREAELSLGISVMQNTMETAWNDEVPESLLSDTQSLVLQRLDEEEMMSIALAESMVTAQLERFRIDEDSKDTSEVACEKANTDNWDSAQKKSDIINTTPSQENPKQCHDSNNNNAKSDIIPKISTEITRKQGVRDWANDEGDDINQLSATITNSCTEKHDPHDICEKDAKNIGSDSVKPLSGENSKAEKVEGVKSRQSLTGKSHVPSSSVPISKSKSIIDEKQTDEDNSKRCHKVQITRTQSYNNQYIRNKALGRPQPRYSQTITKSDQDLSKKPPGSGSMNPGPTNQPSSSMDSRQRCNPSRVPSTRDGYYRRYDQQDPKRRETEQNPSHRPTSGSYNPSGSVPMRNSTRTFEGSSSNKFERNSSYNGNRMQQNATSGKPVPPNPKTPNDRYDRDYNGDGQRLKRDSNVYRRSTDYSSARYQHVKPKVDDHRPSYSGGNNVVRHDREEDKDQPSNSAVSNTSRANETSEQNIRPPESNQHIPSQPEEEQFRESINTPQISVSNTHSNMKIGQDQEISSCNNKASAIEAKAVKFAENIHEIDLGSHNMPAYMNNPPQPNRQSSNTFMDVSQNINHMSSMQQVECVQNLPVEQYFDNTVTYSHVSPISIHSSEHQQSQMQKDGQIVQTLSSTCMPHMSNVAMAGGGLIHYQNHPGLYMNQYNPVHNMPRKSTEVANMPQNTSSTNNSVPSAGTQNVMAGDSSNMMMHGNQAAAAPPPGFHNHPQQEQWAIAHPEMVYFGNMMNTMHPLGMPVQNLRPPCGGDYNALQQAGYLQQPVIYMPPMCMQGWNPLMQCPGPLLQTPQYAGYNLSHQVLPSSNLMEPVSCPVSSPAQSHQYKSYQQQGEGDYRKELSPQKMDACGNLQGPISKLGNTKAKDNALDVHMRASQYYQAPNDYQNTSQDTQVMSPYTYSAPIVPPMKACPLNVHSQTYQKYPLPRNVTTTNYPRYSENPHYHNRDYGRKDDMSKNDSDFIPPMVSPRECMFFGGNYSRKTDYMPSSTLKSEMKH